MIKKLSSWQQFKHMVKIAVFSLVVHTGHFITKAIKRELPVSHIAPNNSIIKHIQSQA